MASFVFSALAPDSIIDFDPLGDVLAIDGDIAAARIRPGLSGDGRGVTLQQLDTLGQAVKTVTLRITPTADPLNVYKLTTGNIVFGDGSQLLIGDNATATTDDAYTGTLFGTAHDDRLIGTNASQSLDGGAGMDVLSGGGGDDALIGGAGNDSLLGGFGSDTYVVDSVGDVVQDYFVDAIVRVSTSSAEAQANGGSDSPQITPDGRYVAFSSGASNLVPGDSNGMYDVFVKDLQTGTLQRASLDATGAEYGLAAIEPQITPDGHYAVFSLGNALFEYIDTTVVRKDLQTGAIQYVSQNASGLSANNDANAPQITANGRYVVFHSTATNLVSGDTNGRTDIFLKDLQTGQVQRVSVNAAGLQGDGNSAIPQVTPDGRYVVFQSGASNLVANDNNGAFDIFRKDMQTGAIQRVSENADGLGGSFGGASASAQITPDGRYVVFESTASGLVAGDTNGVSDIFVKDMLTGAIQRVSTDAFGAQGNGSSYHPQISADGRYVVFQSWTSHLVPGDTNETGDIFVKDVQTGAIRNLSIGAAGSTVVTAPQITPDGRTVVFASWADNLVAGDTNGESDVFVIGNPLFNEPATLDTVQSSVSYALPDAIENLELTGSDAINGIGNGLDNRITGNGAANVLLGGIGNDTLLGGAGNDTLNGGSGDDSMAGGPGADVYVVASAGDLVLDHVPDVIRRVSTDSSGAEGNFGSLYPQLTPDGRYVVFHSFAGNLVAGDTNNASDIFRKDLQTGAILRVSTAVTGAEGSEASTFPQVTADGRYVAFQSWATNLVPGDSNGWMDVFVKDVQTGTVQRASTDAGGVEGNQISYSPGITADGRYVVFVSEADNLVAGDTNGQSDIFRKDLQTGAIQLVSTSDAEVQGNAYSAAAQLTPDGRYVVFESAATNLVAGDTNGQIDIFRKDLQTGAIQRVSIDAAGMQGNWLSTTPQITPDGRYVVFESAATGLVAGDTNGAIDIFLKDMQSGAISRVSTGVAGVQGSGPSFLAQISADGRYVAFQSLSANLVAGDTNEFADVFIKDVQTGAIQRVSISATGEEADNYSDPLSFSADGRYLAIQSPAGNLVGETNNAMDVFLVENPLFDAGARDMVQASISYTLPDRIENLELTGSGAITGSGNGLANLIVGNLAPNLLAGAAGADTLVGGYGDDTLDGGGGDDSLDGGLGADTYLVDSSGDVVGDYVPESIRRVSDSASGAQGNDGSTSPAVTLDGRYVVFESDASNLVAGDMVGQTGIFRKDMLTGAIQRISTDAIGRPANQGAHSPQTTPDGRYVVFESAADNLVAGDTNGQTDVFVKDLHSGDVTRVSTGPNGEQASGASSSAQITSPESLYVVFESTASDLVSDSNGQADIFRKNLVTGELARVSTDSTGQQANGYSVSAQVTPDGRYVAFVSNAGNLVAGDTNGTDDVFVKDMATGLVRRVSTGAGGLQGNGSSSSPHITADGNYVVFISTSDNLVAGDTNGQADVFIKSVFSFDGTIQRVSTSGSGAQANGSSFSPQISADGRYVSFGSDADNLVGGDGNSWSDIFVKDVQTGAIQRLSVNAAGIEANHLSYPGQLSAAGQYIVFASVASNLSGADVNGAADVFLTANPLFSETGVADTVIASVDYILPEGVENLRLSGSVMSGTGNALDNVITGNVAGNLLSGGDGADVLEGLGGADTLSGNAGNDALYGGEGDDTLDGGSGNDRMWGGIGSDVYVVDATGDSVSDFNSGPIQRVSTSATGTEANGFSGSVQVTPDGRYMVFVSEASNLIAGDTNNYHDVFRKDLQTGAIERVSTDAAGIEGNNYSSTAQITADGRYVAFASAASNLVANDTNGSYDIFAKDLQTGNIQLLSSNAEGVAGNNLSLAPTLTPDGRYAVFLSYADNLVAGDTNNAGDIFRKDLQTGAIERVSVDSSGMQADFPSDMASITPDGRYVVFSSYASNLVAGDTNGQVDIFRKDLQTGAIQRVTTNLAGDQADGASYSPQITPDGRYVVFYSIADNLVTGDSNFANDIFVKDMLTGDIQRISTDAMGMQANAASYAPTITADGRQVVFTSQASNLVAGDTNSQVDIFVKDLQAGTIQKILPNDVNAMSFEAQMTPDGRFVLFESDASNLVAGDSNSATDIFLTANPLSNEDGTTDVVHASISYGLPDRIENLQLTGSDAIDGSGNSLSNLLTGNLAANSLFGGEGADTLFGADGNDSLTGGAGNDDLDGGNGFDTANYSGNRAGYLISQGNWYHYTISDINPADGDDGIDHVFGIEQLQFADTSTSLQASKSWRGIKHAPVQPFWAGTEWQPVDTGHDFNADGWKDVVLAKPDGTIGLWLMSGATPVNALVFDPVPGRTLVDAATDYNADGKTDLKWHESDGSESYWLMDTGWTLLS